MVLWALLIVITVVSCLSLFLAGRNTLVNVEKNQEHDVRLAHLRRLHSEIESDLETGRISQRDADSAKGELAREVIRNQKQDQRSDRARHPLMGWIVPASVLVVGVVGLSLYTVLGAPDLPSQPMAQRQKTQLADVNVQDAITQVEKRLEQQPDDVRGWQVLAPIYMRTGRFAEAATAFRNILALSPPSADAEVNLAEALMMMNDGEATGEPITLLQSAAARDPSHIRSRFYLAGEATQKQEFERAIELWQELLLLAQGDEPWVLTARQGLEIAQAGSAPGSAIVPLAPDHEQRELIDGMVAGLAERLNSDGGSIEEWTRMVRSHLVLGKRDDAQAAYDAAKRAFPSADDRIDLDALAAQNELK
jgi:cytochrome c-type biogenesis protein CcmH